MIDGIEIIEFALEDFGQDAIVNGHTLRVILEADSAVEMVNTSLSGGTIATTGEYCIALASSVDSLGLNAGNSGDLLEVAGKRYTVLGIDPDGRGGVIISIERRP